MISLVPALARAVNQLPDPPIRRVVWQSVLGALFGFFTYATWALTAPCASSTAWGTSRSASFASFA